MSYNKRPGKKVESIEQVKARSVGSNLMKEMIEGGATSVKFDSPVKGIVIICTDKKTMEELPRSDMEPLNHLCEEEKTLFRCPVKARGVEKSKTEESDLMLTLNGKIDYTHQDTIKIILRGRHA